MMKKYRSHRGVPVDVLAVIDADLAEASISRAKRAFDGKIKPEKLERTMDLLQQLKKYRQVREAHLYPHLYMESHLWQHPQECGYWPFDSE